MKKLLIGISTILLMIGSASANIYTFNYGGYDWGTMTVLQHDENTLSVQYDASSTIPNGSEATGFGFGPALGAFTISDPADSFFSWDQNNLDWVALENLNAIPNPANSSAVSKKDFKFGATGGNNNNFTPPGILPGQSDIFYLDFTNDVSLSGLSLVGVRLQSLPETINTGSLFLVGDPGTPGTQVPEPATMLLFGAGLVGLAGIARRKIQ